VWLLRNAEVLAAVEVAESFADRSRGLLGRRGFDGALLLAHTRAVHTLGMRFPLDVAFLDTDLVVLDLCTVRPWRLARPRRGGRQVLEAEAGAFERWKLRRGDRLELCDTR
jgi:uncharacterized protein